MLGGASVLAVATLTLLAGAPPSEAAAAARVTSVTLPASPVTVPPVTVTVPAVTVPPVTAPSVSLPPVSLPPVTVPPVTVPPVTPPPTGQTTVPTTVAGVTVPPGPDGLAPAPVPGRGDPSAPGAAGGTDAGPATSGGATRRPVTGLDDRSADPSGHAVVANDVARLPDVNAGERSLPAAIASSVRSFVPAVALMVLIAAFLIVEASFDRRDPKLARSPLDDADETLPFS